MVFGLLTIAAIPTVTGVAESVSEQRRQNREKADEKRMDKFYVDVWCDCEAEGGGDGDGTSKARDVNGKRVVFRDGKAYLDNPHPSLRRLAPAHTAQAFYITYPETEETKSHPRSLGLVSTVSDDPPMLNWIYADKDTHELRYGNRSQSIEHVVGPWDWTKGDEAGVTLEGKGLFVAVEEEDGVWAVYFDRDGDGLGRVLGERGMGGRSVVEVSLERTLVDREGKGD